MRLIKPSTIIIFTLLFVLFAVVAASAKTESKKIPLTEKDVFCLTRNAYYEARGDSQMSQVAVTHVVLNRLYHESYPSSACDVIYQKNRSESKGNIVCQFSWYCDKTLMRRNIDLKAWNEALESVNKALKMYYQKGVDITDGSTFYHAYYVNPGWRHLEKVTSIGSHIYYKESDDNGSTGRSAYEKIVFRIN